jgi:hypothetical protein
MELVRVEGAQLAQLVDDFRVLVGADRDVSDPAVLRLAPNAYPDDAEAAQAFSEATRGDLLDRRALDADVVRNRLSDLRGDIGDMPEHEALAPYDLAIPLGEVDSWLRTLTAVRLVIAERLGIDAEDTRDDSDARFGVYDWLGYRLEVLIESADQLL